MFIAVSRKERFNVCLFGLFSSRIISIWAQYESCYYEKNCPRSNNKKDDYGVKKKSSNVTLSWMGKCYSRFPSSHFFFHVQEESWKQIKLLTQNIGWFLYKPKKSIRIWLNHSWANQRKLIEVDFVKVLGEFKLAWRKLYSS